MRRAHPLLSPTGLVFTGLLSVALVLILWRTGGQIFSPGQLSARSTGSGTLGGVRSHAEITACSSCHQPLAVTQDQLCTACHLTIRDEMRSGGLHARIENANRCFACHTDHRGPDLDLVQVAITNFDHELTSFSLFRHQIDFDAGLITCEDCHRAGDYVPEAAACVECHGLSDPAFMRQHELDFGRDCLACHDGADRMTGFDHMTTGFSLEGEHAEVRCVACHAVQPFSDTQSACEGCHTEPELHRGLFGSDCAACHTAAGWTPASLEGADFEHLAATGFSLEKHDLDYDGRAISCSTCHESALQSFSLVTCETCHRDHDPAFMAAHVSAFGQACLDCHDGLDRMEGFNHDEYFVLEGQHATIACIACHENRIFAGTPDQCSQCHTEPAIHAGAFGLNCEACHSTTAWAPAVLTSHIFPLDHGGEGTISCLTCHPSTYIDFTCDACHAPAEMREEHDKEEIFDIANRCADCHPTGIKEEGRSTADD